MVAAGTETTAGPEAAAPSLRGELCCVDTEPGLRPLTGHGSPGGRGQAGVSSSWLVYEKDARPCLADSAGR